MELPMIIVSKNRNRKMKNRIFAISRDAPEMFVKPRIPAIIETIKKIKLHLSIYFIMDLYFDLLTYLKTPIG